MNEKDRIKILIKALGKKQEEFEEECGIKKYKLRNALKKGATLTIDLLDQIIKKYPEYEVWVKTGFEIPEKGQISPMTRTEAEKNKMGNSL